MAGYLHRQQLRLGVLVTPQLAERWEAFAAKNELTMTEVARRALVAFLADNENN